MKGWLERQNLQRTALQRPPAWLPVREEWHWEHIQVRRCVRTLWKQKSPFIAMFTWQGRKPAQTHLCSSKLTVLQEGTKPQWASSQLRLVHQLLYCMLGCITRPDAAQGEQVVHRICRGAAWNATSDLVGNRATALKLIAGWSPGSSDVWTASDFQF